MQLLSERYREGFGQVLSILSLPYSYPIRKTLRRKTVDEILQTIRTDI